MACKREENGMGMPKIAPPDLVNMWLASSGDGPGISPASDNLRDMRAKLIQDHRRHLELFRSMIDHVLSMVGGSQPSDSAGARTMLKTFLDATETGKWVFKWNSELRHRLTSDWWLGPMLIHNLNEIHAALDDLLGTPVEQKPAMAMANSAPGTI
jgi:hypothetical protein